MPEIRNYNLDIEIDETDLESEWLTHPSIYMYYSTILADAIAQRDNAKLKMEWIAANIDLDVRKNWDTKYEFVSKPAEGAIKNTILTNKKYLAAHKKYIKCLKRVNSMNGVKTAFEHKKHALGNLVSLQITGFHSEPRNKNRDLQKQISMQNHEHHKLQLQDALKQRKNKK